MSTRTTLKRGLSKADKTADTLLRKTANAKNRIVAGAEDELDAATSTLRQAAETAGTYVGEKLEAGRNGAQHMAEQVESHVRGKPLSSLAAAFVGGLVVAGLLSRK